MWATEHRHFLQPFVDQGSYIHIDSCIRIPLRLQGWWIGWRSDMANSRPGKVNPGSISHVFQEAGKAFVLAPALSRSVCWIQLNSLFTCVHHSDFSLTMTVRSQLLTGFLCCGFFAPNFICQLCLDRQDFYLLRFTWRQKAGSLYRFEIEGASWFNDYHKACFRSHTSLTRILCFQLGERISLIVWPGLNHHYAWTPILIS